MLRCKIGIVTGGAGGIGSVTCKILAEEGAKVVVADLDLDSRKKIVKVGEWSAITFS